MDLIVDLYFSNLGKSLFLWYKIENYEANYEVFNVGMGEAIDVMSVANELVKAYNSVSKINRVESVCLKNLLLLP